MPSTLVRVAVATALLLSALSFWLIPASARQPRPSVKIAARAPAELREWNGRLRRMQRDGRLRLRQRRSDFLVEGRTHERFDQYFRGVRVFGADVAQQFSGGQLISAFGRVYVRRWTPVLCNQLATLGCRWRALGH